MSFYDVNVIQCPDRLLKGHNDQMEPTGMLTARKRERYFNGFFNRVTGLKGSRRGFMKWGNQVRVSSGNQDSLTMGPKRFLCLSLALPCSKKLKNIDLQLID